MRRLIPVGLVALAVYGYQQSRDVPRADPPAGKSEFVADAEPVEPVASRSPAAVESPFRCDGRKYCSQMTSCEEAIWFLQNCPGVKMDGDRRGRGDGIPCEQQWCGHLR